MRTIEDHTGTAWDVVVGKESYGVMVLLFSRHGAMDVRRVPVDAVTRLQAERLLRDLSMEALEKMLAAAKPVNAAPPDS